MSHADDNRSVDERALLLAARGGDERAFGRLVELHRGGLELFSRLMLGDAVMARHVLSETMLTAWRERRSIQPHRTARMWLYRIVARECFSAIGDHR
jgi:DNA-directed RNA polymerase specialized sigma24 family protein